MKSLKKRTDNTSKTIEAYRSRCSCATCPNCEVTSCDGCYNVNVGEKNYINQSLIRRDRDLEITNNRITSATMGGGGGK